MSRHLQFKHFVSSRLSKLQWVCKELSNGTYIKCHFHTPPQLSSLSFSQHQTHYSLDSYSLVVTLTHCLTLSCVLTLNSWMMTVTSSPSLSPGAVWLGEWWSTPPCQGCTWSWACQTELPVCCWPWQRLMGRSPRAAWCPARPDPPTVASQMGASLTCTTTRSCLGWPDGPICTPHVADIRLLSRLCRRNVQPTPGCPLSSRLCCRNLHQAVSYHLVCVLYELFSWH